MTSSTSDRGWTSETLDTRHPESSEQVLLLPVDEAGLDPGLGLAAGHLILQLGQKVSNVVINILLVPGVSILL